MLRSTLILVFTTATLCRVCTTTQAADATHPNIVYILGDDNGRRGEPDWFKQERGYVPHDQPGELFNLREDLIEKTNRYAERPELVQELGALLARYRESGRSTPAP